MDSGRDTKTCRIVKLIHMSLKVNSYIPHILKFKLNLNMTNCIITFYFWLFKLQNYCYCSLFISTYQYGNMDELVTLYMPTSNLPVVRPKIISFNYLNIFILLIYFNGNVIGFVKHIRNLTGSYCRVET